MKGYVEMNLREYEKITAICHVTWTAFVPIVLRAVFTIPAAWLIATAVTEYIFEIRIRDPYDLAYFASSTSAKDDMVPAVVFYA